VEISAHAKINLTLDVAGRCRDGYHELASVMQEIELADTLVLDMGPSEISLWVDPPVVSAGEDNLVLQAARLLREYGQVRQGAVIGLRKRIPVGAGLGGGSADAAATLLGLNGLWGLHLSPDTLKELGARLGSDIPFCLTGGTALVTGRGEVVEPLAPLPAASLLLVKPPFPVSTAEVYRLWDERGLSGGAGTPAMLAAVAGGDWRAVAGCLANDLEEVTCGLHPEVTAVKRTLWNAGALAVLMSGSGPAVFSLWPDGESARRAGLGFPESYYQVLPTRTFYGPGQASG